MDVSISQKPLAIAPQVPEPQPPPSHDETPSNAHAGFLPRHRPVPAPVDPQKHPQTFPRPYLSYRSWRNLSRRTLLIIAVVALALLALIIGLAAGLTHRSSTQNLPLPSANGGPYTG